MNVAGVPYRTIRLHADGSSVEVIDQTKLPHLLELKYRAINDAATELGGVAKIRDAFVGFQRHLYM